MIYLTSTLLIVVTPILALHSNQLGNIDGAKVFRVILQTEEALDSLQQIFKTEVADFWTKPRELGDAVDLMTVDWMVPVMQNKLKAANISYEVIKEDVKEAVESHLKDVRERRKDTFDWSSYYPYEDILLWLENIRTEYPSFAFVKSIGETIEGRDLMLVKLTKGKGSKPAVWINAGIYGREWISIASATYLIDYILTEGDSLLDEYDFFIVPVANPDGYVFSWTDVRLWSKSRYDEKLPSGCVGVDLNRNWNISWNEHGKRNNPCLDSFPGKDIFSEPETMALKDTILRESSRLDVFLSLEAYGQKWLSACSYSGDGDCSDLVRVGKRIAEAASLGKRSREYEYVEGSPSIYKYSMPGTSVAWSKFVAGIKYSFAVELPDKGSSGYLLPPKAIKSVGEEVALGLQVLLKFIKHDKREKEEL